MGSDVPPAATDLAQLLNCLRSGRAHERAAAAQVLAHTADPSPEVLTGLIAALTDADVAVRLAVARALQRFGRQAVPALLAALDGADAAHRHAIVGALGMLGPAARPALPRLTQLQADAELGPVAAAAVQAIRDGQPIRWERLVTGLLPWFLVGFLLLEAASQALSWAGLFAGMGGVALQISLAWTGLGAYFGAVLGAGMQGRLGVVGGARRLGLAGACAGAFVGRLAGLAVEPLVRALGG